MARNPKRSRNLSFDVDRLENPVRWWVLWFLSFVGGYTLAGDILSAFGAGTADGTASRYIVSATIVTVLFVATRRSARSPSE